MKFYKMLCATFSTSISVIDLMAIYNADAAKDLLRNAQIRNKMFLFNYEAFQKYNLAKETKLENNYTLCSTKKDDTYKASKLIDQLTNSEMNFDKNELIKFSENTGAPEKIRANISESDILALDGTGNVTFKDGQEDPLESTKQFITDKLIPAVLQTNQAYHEDNYKSALIELLLSYDNIAKKICDNNDNGKGPTITSQIEKLLTDGLGQTIRDLNNKDKRKARQLTNTLFMLYLLNDMCARFRAFNNAASTILSKQADLLDKHITYKDLDKKDQTATFGAVIIASLDSYLKNINIRQELKDLTEKKQISYAISKQKKHSQDINSLVTDLENFENKETTNPTTEETLNIFCHPLSTKEVKILFKKIAALSTFTNYGSDLVYEQNLLYKLKTQLNKFLNLFTIQNKQLTISKNWLNSCWVDFQERIKNTCKAYIRFEIDTKRDCLAYLKGFDLMGILLKEQVATSEKPIESDALDLVDSYSILTNTFTLDDEIINSIKTTKNAIRKLTSNSSETQLFQHLDMLNKRMTIDPTLCLQRMFALRDLKVGISISDLNSLALNKNINYSSSNEQTKFSLNLFDKITQQITNANLNIIQDTNTSNLYLHNYHEISSTNCDTFCKVLYQPLIKYLLLITGGCDKKTIEETCRLLPIVIADIRHQLEDQNVFTTFSNDEIKNFHISPKNWPNIFIKNLYLNPLDYNIENQYHYWDSKKEVKDINISLSKKHFTEEEIKQFTTYATFYNIIIDSSNKLFLSAHMENKYNYFNRKMAGKLDGAYLSILFNNDASLFNIQFNLLDNIRTSFKQMHTIYKELRSSSGNNYANKIREIIYKDQTVALFETFKVLIKDFLTFIGIVPEKNNKNLEGKILNGKDFYKSFNIEEFNKVPFQYYDLINKHNMLENYYGYFLAYKMKLVADISYTTKLLTTEAPKPEILLSTVEEAIKALPLISDKEFFILLYSELISERKILIAKDQFLQDIKTAKEKYAFSNKNVTRLTAEQLSKKLEHQFYMYIGEALSQVEKNKDIAILINNKQTDIEKAIIDNYNKTQTTIRDTVNTIKNTFLPYKDSNTYTTEIYFQQTFLVLFVDILNIYIQNIVNEDDKKKVTDYIINDFNDIRYRRDTQHNNVNPNNTQRYMRSIANSKWNENYNFIGYFTENVSSERVVKALINEIILNNNFTSKTITDKFIFTIFTSIKNCFDKYIGIIIEKADTKTLSFDFKRIEQQLDKLITQYKLAIRNITSDSTADNYSEKTTGHIITFDFASTELKMQLVQQQDDQYNKTKLEAIKDFYIKFAKSIEPIVDNAEQYKKNYSEYLELFFIHNLNIIKDKQRLERKPSSADAFTNLIENITDYVPVSSLPKKTYKK